MYGYNYQTTFGINTFQECSSIKEAMLQLKKTYPSSNAESISPVLFELEDFWDEINYGLSYRGDRHAGLPLNEKKEMQLEKVQLEYKNLISQFIHHNTKIYSYPDEKGIPGYEVYWGYRFLLLSSNGTCAFIYASASD